MIRALFLDLDGTLLDSRQRISPATCAALQKCRDNGIRVFVATARPPLLSRMLRLSPGESQVIADGGLFYNGGCVVCNGQKHYTTVPEQAVRLFMESIAAYPEANAAVQMTEEVHSFRHELPDMEYARWGVTQEDRLAFHRLRHDAVVKIVVFSPHSVLPGLHGELSRRLGSHASVYLTGGFDFRAVEVVSRSINKKLAIDRIAALCGIGPGELAVFGNDTNDVEMLQGFELSVAMGNAHENARSAAKYVTLSNDQDGIVHALKNIFGLV